MTMTNCGKVNTLHYQMNIGKKAGEMIRPCSYKQVLDYSGLNQVTEMDISECGEVIYANNTI